MHANVDMCTTRKVKIDIFVKITTEQNIYIDVDYNQLNSGGKV